MADTDVGVTIEKENLKFSCAHFICDHGYRERLHGHNYKMSLKVTATAAYPNNDVDFRKVESVARNICSEFDERTLIPLHNKHHVIDLSMLGKVNIICEDKQSFSFPLTDCKLLPIVQTSCEEITKYIWAEISSRLNLSAYIVGRMKVTISDREDDSFSLSKAILAEDVPLSKISLQEYNELVASAMFQSILSGIERVVDGCCEKVEGNCFTQHMDVHNREDILKEKQLNLFSLGKHAKRVLEIGFNAGHSSLLFLLSSPTSQVTHFDICCHKYTEKCFDYLSTLFPGRLTLICGDSRVSVPRYYEEHLTEQFDLVHIDGGHDPAIANADFYNCYPLSSSIIVWDDTQAEVLNNLLDDYISRQLVEEVEQMYKTSILEHRIVKKTDPSSKSIATVTSPHLLIEEDHQRCDPLQTHAADSSKDNKTVRTIVINGASHGFGQAVTKTLVKVWSGSHVILIAKSKDGLAETEMILREHDSSATVTPIDMGSGEDIDRIINELSESIKENTGPIVLVNNAGMVVGSPQHLVDVNNSDVIQRHFYINVTTPILLTTAVLRRAKSNKVPFTVVNVRSPAALQPIDGLGIYCSGKAAMDMFHRCLQEEKIGFSHPIRILNYAPGPLSTAMQNVMEGVPTDSMNDTVYKEHMDWSESADKLACLLFKDVYEDGSHVDYTYISNE